MANKPSPKRELNPVLNRPSPIRVPNFPVTRAGPALARPRIFTPHIGLNLGTG